MSERDLSSWCTKNGSQSSADRCVEIVMDVDSLTTATADTDLDDI